MPLGYHPVDSSIGNGLLEPQPLHLRVAPQPALTTYLCKGERHDHCDVPRLTPTIDASLELFKLCGGPGQDIDNQAVADLLKAVHSGTYGAGAYEHVDVAVQEAI